VGNARSYDAELLHRLPGLPVTQAAAFRQLLAGQSVWVADDQRVDAAVPVLEAARDLGVVAEHGRVELPRVQGAHCLPHLSAARSWRYTSPHAARMHTSKSTRPRANSNAVMDSPKNEEWRCR